MISVEYTLTRVNSMIDSISSMMFYSCGNFTKTSEITLKSSEIIIREKRFRYSEFESFLKEDKNEFILYILFILLMTWQHRSMKISSHGIEFTRLREIIPANNCTMQGQNNWGKWGSPGVMKL